MKLEKIYRVGEKHFFAKQYSDVKLDNIANDLGIKKPSLYYYFENKRDFYIKTLKYSMKKYILELRSVIEQRDLDAYLRWYLIYPSTQTNLFAIAVFKGDGHDDKEITNTILAGKRVIKNESHQFLASYDLSEISIYLICSLMDKLAMENCIEGYCLDYSIDKLSKQVSTLIERCKDL